MNRWDIINSLIKKINAKKYLEIGIYHGWNFNKIVCDYKIGVDPDHRSICDYHLTSDEFFAQNTECFDVIFIDGLHHSDVVERDINNSLQILEINGYIICHDMNPLNEETQIIPQQTADWTGDCWKAWVKIRSTHSNIKMCVVDTDCGCGIITRGKQNLIDLNCTLTYNKLQQNRKQWLNLITVDEFKKEFL